MTKQELAKQAFEECCNPETTVKYGVKRGFPFWNVESTMFMYVPAFHFTAIRACEKYRYDAVDEYGKNHSFIADDCCVLLTPIWAELPEGLVKLTVTALNDDGSDYAIVGARTFFRSSPFPGDTPAAKCTYTESAIKALRYAMKQPFIQHWLNEGTPDPDYDLNVYPCKMIASIVSTMISFSKISKDDAADALKVAKNACDWLMKITPRGDVALSDLPPTYYLDFCDDPVKHGIDTCNYYAAKYHMGTMMMFYCADIGQVYVELTQATGDKKYLEEAIKIGNYYVDTVEPNGSWYLVRSTETGKPLTENYISPLESVVPFLKELAKATGNKKYDEVADGAIKYVIDTQLSTYNWEGQFEDSPLSTNYMNLTHYGPVALAEYYCTYRRDDEECMKTAKELIRFAEDQFVIWKKPYPFKHHTPDGEAPYDTSIWPTPCALEQYGWYVPIDASASEIIHGFLAMYKAGCGSLYLAKAKALANMITVVQHEDGKIPTHWMNTEGAEKNFWFNCMFHSCRILAEISEFQDVEP